MRSQSFFVSKKWLSVTLLSSLLLTISVVGDGFVYADNGVDQDKKVFAEKSEILPSWGSITINEQGIFASGSDCSNQRIIFGINPDTGKPMPWWIASRTLANGQVSLDPQSSSHMILYAAQDILSKQFDQSEENEINFNSLKESIRKEIDYLGERKVNVNVNHYALSNCRKILKTFSKGAGMFSKGERKLIKEAKVKTLDSKILKEYTLNDKLYLPSGNKELGLISWGEDDIVNAKSVSQINKENVIPFDYLVNKSTNDERIMWLRSADPQKQCCSYVAIPFNEIKVQSQRVIYSFEIMPVLKMSVESLLFASAASSTYCSDICCTNGSFTEINRDSSNYGMHLKLRADGTDLTDGFLTIDNNQNYRVNYGNIPKSSYIVVCAVDNNQNYYTTAMEINRDGNFPDGFIDLNRLDTSKLGLENEIRAKVWIERKEDAGIVVATPPKDINFTTQKTLEISGINDVVYNGEERVFTDINVKIGDKVLQSLSDYDVEYTSNKEVGLALAVIRGKGEYQGYVLPKSFNITKAVPKITLEDKKFAFDGTAKFLSDASIKGVKEDDIPKSKVTYSYYKDEQCKQKICAYTWMDEDTKLPGKVPNNIGIYYVKASISEDANYFGGESNIIKLEIKEIL